jgi:hypothetical protein
MKSVSFTQAMEAAAFGLVGQRCRQAYIHDIRGGLQALGSAIELLARSAKSPAQHSALLEKASALAQRAMATHEQVVIDIVQGMAPIDERATVVNLGDLIREAVHFLRNDAVAKSITLHSTLAAGVCISTEPLKCRLLIIGLIVMAIDTLAAGSVIDIRVAHSGSEALLEFKSAAPYSQIRDPSDLWAGLDSVPPGELMLAVTSRWVCTNGGRIQLDLADSPGELRIYYPMASPKAVA